MTEPSLLANVAFANLFLRTSPLTAEESEQSSLRSELYAILSLLHDVLQRQFLLLFRLVCRQLPASRGTCSPDNNDIPDPSAVHRFLLESALKKDRRISLPLFPLDKDSDFVPVSNFFALLKKLTEPAARGTPTLSELPVSRYSKVGRKGCNSLIIFFYPLGPSSFLHLSSQTLRAYQLASSTNIVI